MLLYKQNRLLDHSPQGLIESSNTIEDLRITLQYLIQLQCLPKYLPDIMGRLRLIIRTSEESNLGGKLIELYDVIWYNKEFFRNHPDDAIEAILCIEKAVMDQEIFRQVGNHPNAFFGLTAPSERLLSMIETEGEKEYREAILVAYTRKLFGLCDVYGYPYDQVSMFEVFRNLSFHELVKFATDPDQRAGSTSHIEIVKKWIDDQKEVFLQNEDASEELAKETEEAFFKGMLMLYDIWNHPYTIGKMILNELQKYSLQCRSEATIHDYFNMIRDKHPNQNEMLEDIELFYKNLFILFTKFPQKRYSSIKEDYEYSYGPLGEYVYDTILAYIYQNKKSIDSDFFLDLIPNIVSMTLENIPTLEKEQKMGISHIVDEQIKRIRHQDSINGILPDSDARAMNILLGIFDEEEEIVEPASEASVIKDDTGSKVGDANMPKDTRSRDTRGRYTKKTADAKSVGLTIGHAFSIFNQQKDQIEKQIDNGYNALKDVLFGAKEVRTAVVEGKKFSITSLIKKLLGFMCLFSFGKVRAILFLITRAVARGKIRKAERRRIIQDIEEELALIDEKINDASADGDRKAKYALMRSRSQLQHALERIKYGMEGADDSKAIQNMRANNERTEF